MRRAPDDGTLAVRRQEVRIRWVEVGAGVGDAPDALHVLTVVGEGRAGASARCVLARGDHGSVVRRLVAALREDLGCARYEKQSHEKR